jgi:molybdopterin biosynthesis enzyme MoaB
MQEELLRDADVLVPIILQVAGVLASSAHPSHIVVYAPGSSHACRLSATRTILGIVDDFDLRETPNYEHPVN